MGDIENTMKVHEYPYRPFGAILLSNIYLEGFRFATHPRYEISPIKGCYSPPQGSVKSGFYFGEVARLRDGEVVVS